MMRYVNPSASPEEDDEDCFRSNGFTDPIDAKAHLYWRFNASLSASDKSHGFGGSSSLRAMPHVKAIYTAAHWALLASRTQPIGCSAPTSDEQWSFATLPNATELVGCVLGCC